MTFLDFSTVRFFLASTLICVPFSATAELANPKAYIQSHAQQKNVKDNTTVESEKNYYRKLSNDHHTLTQALKRESNNNKVDNREVLNLAEQQLQYAKTLAQKKQFAEANKVLQQSYEQLKSALIPIENAKNQNYSAAEITTSTENTLGDSVQTQLEREFKTQTTLIDALKRQNDEKSGGKQEEIDRIQSRADEARKLMEQGDTERALTLIRETNQQTKSNIASLQTSTTTTTDVRTQDSEQAKEDYTQRKASTLALMDAGRRITQEQHHKQPAFGKAEAIISDADKLAEQNKFTDARVRIDQAYLLVKGEMRNLLNKSKTKK